MDLAVLRKPGELTTDQQLADQIADFYADPLGYVMFNWDWQNDQEIQMVELVEPWASRYGCKYGPDVWACKYLDDLGAEVKKRGFNGRIAVDAIQMSTASGHGIGKSTLVAWLVHWIMDTRPFCKGTVTANTAEQLIGKTWAELGKWTSKAITGHLYTYSATRGNMTFVRKGYEKAGSWVTRGQTCREENSEAFAGQHAANSTSFYIFDEASAVPDKIFEVREGGLTDGEPMAFDFGNPTRNTGAFFENCVGKRKKAYVVRCIDSRSVAITNKKKIDEWIETYGIDSDFVKVRILGVFPSAGSLQFIGSDIVRMAMQREVYSDRSAALIIGVDVARFGDDETVIYPRIGNDARTFAPWRYRGLDTVQVTGRVIEAINFFRKLGLECSALFVDGGGIGAGVVDQLRHLRYNPIEVQFGGGASDKQTYRYKSDEMWGNMRDKIRASLILPAENTQTGRDLQAQLTQREYGYTIQGNKVHLESKVDMKERLGSDFGSPDLADALALTFAQDIAPAQMAVDPNASKGHTAISDYDPYTQP